MKAFVVDLDSSKNQIMLKSSVRSFNNQAHQINEAAEKIHELIKNAPYSNDNIVLKRNEIKEAFFSPFKPQLKNAQVFLSHSHADRNKALEVKNYLESQTKRKVFIDSLFWDYKDDVLNKLARYDDISKIEDAFTLILRESLQDMIEKCPYFVFLQSKNSVSNQGLSRNQDLLKITYSAWIYEELKIAHSISESRPIPMMESMQVFHDISPFLKSFETITLKKLSQQINS
ncbi:toll/interleukin-1 receptor domain-containing protein [Helicobacter pylori]|uniref:toll/interleukin-1 receptor domain-containing protein n=1 Tax=Helicobacter pylori TaxID=210 RepID=UPI000EB48FFF|nr:toll/interleukin-1 receptor domain-containing protein [Helicobacter pylori]MCH4604868.1 toll/interleukin-1 receptor domain-containing protein [Helicobacter pylori]WJI92600.1 toll/interleukin-1 receptor domain-containing protein [Helicobacter pylori]WNE32464.1 toll/interleukin-1 receptor domain-containing protein [Helicobacter pylori]WNE33890.1 toll/interleukin-1 receptor domain-containing protein [Helicobacter pylori]WNE35318.1 toll/interleukin-1 receptor domain-containing protein [Helicoba